MRILLVEDEENIREVITLNLEMENYEVIQAASGREAIRLFNEQHFDLLILDVMLPEMDGFQVCEQIRLTNMDVPVIFLTAKDTAADRIAGRRRLPDQTVCAGGTAAPGAESDPPKQQSSGQHAGGI